MGSMVQDLALAIPGVDEAMGFAEIMKSVHVLILVFSFLVCAPRAAEACSSCGCISALNVYTGVGRMSWG